MNNTQSDNPMREDRKEQSEKQARGDGLTGAENTALEESPVPDGQPLATREKLEIIRTLMAEMLPLIAAGLRAGLSNLYLASQQLISEEQREASPELDLYAARMDQNYFRLMRMIHNMDAAVYLRNGEAYHMEPWDIVEVVRKICGESGDLAVWKNIRLAFQCSEPRHVALFDRSAIELVLYHMLSNALKFTGSGGVITVCLRIVGGSIYLEVSDTGCGMTDREQGMLFERSLYLNQMNIFPNGFGLGIPLCHSVARNHNGMLIAASRPQKGSMFIFSMPDRTPKHYQIVRQHRQSQDEDSGFNPTLLALSDAMPIQAFCIHHKD